MGCGKNGFFGGEAVWESGSRFIVSEVVDNKQANDNDHQCAEEHTDG